VIDTEETELERDETPAERVDRNFNELLGELRIALPGVQVLFAFLLTVPFAQGFSQITGFERGLYFAVLLLTAVACAFLIAPTAYHRLQFRRGRKREILFFANRATLFGLGALAAAMTGAIMLITDYLFGTGASVPLGVAAALLFGSLWYLLPVFRAGGPRRTGPGRGR